MGPRVVSDLVTVRNHASHEVRILLRKGPDDEEGGLCGVRGQEVEYRFGPQPRSVVEREPDAVQGVLLPKTPRPDRFMERPIRLHTAPGSIQSVARLHRWRRKAGAPMRTRGIDCPREIARYSPTIVGNAPKT